MPFVLFSLIFLSLQSGTTCDMKIYDSLSQLCSVRGRHYMRSCTSICGNTRFHSPLNGYFLLSVCWLLENVQKMTDHFGSDDVRTCGDMLALSVLIAFGHK